MNPENIRILILEPDEMAGEVLARGLGRIGYQVTAVLTLGRGLSRLKKKGFDLILLPLGVDGLRPRRLIQKIRSASPTVSIVILADVQDVETAVATLKLGAEDYLTKPPDPYEVRSRIGRILERRELNDQLAHLQQALTQRYGLHRFVDRSSGMKKVVETVAQVAPTQSTVLICGESGVGKELVAKAIHYNSPRRDRPFLALNCSALPADLIESELFGHEKGSFTGAVERAKGKFELADGGTILLDEVGEMGLQTQVKLLRVLEEREFMRVGGNRIIRVDVRVLAATNANLSRRILDGSFREDLYFRLKVITLRVPALRERAQDIPELIRIFLDSLTKANDLPPKEVSADALFLMQNYAWPGNVRELKNLMENLVITVTKPLIEPEDLPPLVRGEKGVDEIRPRVEAGMSLREMESDLIRKTLVRTDGNRTRAARILQIGVRTLQRKIKAYDLQ